EVPIPPKARFRVQSGIQTFLVSSVPEPRRQAAPLILAVPTAVLGFLALSAVVHLGILGVAWAVSPQSQTPSVRKNQKDSLLSSVQAKPKEDPKQEEDKKEGKEENSGGTGTKMALDEGKMGKKDSTRASGQYAMKNNNADPQLAKEQAIDNARRTGILG